MGEGRAFIVSFGDFLMPFDSLKRKGKQKEIAETNFFFVFDGHLSTTLIIDYIPPE